MNSLCIMNKPEIHIGIRATFFSGGGAQPIAEENFEHLEPLDCRKRRFQSLNFTFFGTLVQVYCLIPQIFCPTYAPNLPDFSAFQLPPPPPPSRLVRLWKYMYVCNNPLPFYLNSFILIFSVAKFL